MTETPIELKMIEHLKRIMDNLGQYWHSIELLLNIVKHPLVIDDRGLAHVVRQITEKLESIKEEIKNLDLVQILGEIKYIGNRLNNIENMISEMKEEGISKKIHLDLTCDGYEMRRKVNPYDKALEEEKSVDPDKSVEDLLNTLLPRESLIIVHRLGLLGQKKKTLKGIGEIVGVDKERVRQIYLRGMKKLRHPTRKHLVSNITHVSLRKAITGD